MNVLPSLTDDSAISIVGLYSSSWTNSESWSLRTIHHFCHTVSSSFCHWICFAITCSTYQSKCNEPIIVRLKSSAGNTEPTASALSAGKVAYFNLFKFVEDWEVLWWLVQLKPIMKRLGPWDFEWMRCEGSRGNHWWPYKKSLSVKAYFFRKCFSY